MTATFQSLRETRLPKAEKAISLLGNLARYPHDEQEAKDLVNALSYAVDDIDVIFAKKWGWTDEPEPTLYAHDTDVPMKAADSDTYRYEPRTTLPTGPAEGGASFEAEVRWALDAIKRGDTKLAENRLKRILTGEDQ